MEPGLIELLHVGCDGLDIAFEGWFPQSALDALRDAKARARDQMHPEPLELGGVPVRVSEAGARGGYAFTMDTGDDGEIWFIKDRTDNQWNVRVSVRALPLAIHGIGAVVRRLYERLEAFGATVLRESVSRVDIAADFHMPADFRLDIRGFVSRAGRRVYEEPTEEGRQVFWTGDRITSVTVGKQPHRQVIVYDKRREAIQTRKDHWFDIWGVSKRDRRPVWRVEVRGGKRHLKDHWRVSRLADLERRLGDILADALACVRYTVPVASDPNRARWPTHEIWDRARAVFLDYATTTGQPAPGRKVTGRRSTIRQIYLEQATGLMASIAAVDRLGERDRHNVHMRVARAVELAIRDDPAGWDRRVERAGQRQEIMEDWHEPGSIGVPPGHPGCGEGGAPHGQGRGGGNGLGDGLCVAG